MSNCIHAVSDLDRHLPRPAYNELLNNGHGREHHAVHVMAWRHRFQPERDARLGRGKQSDRQLRATSHDQALRSGLHADLRNAD